MVVAGGEDADVVGRGDGGGVDAGLVADGGLIARDGGLLHVVAGLGADEEALLAQDEVDVGDGAFEEVEEGARVEVGLLVVQVQLRGDVLVVGDEGGEELGFDARGDLVVELDFGVEGVLGVPGYGCGGSWGEGERVRRGCSGVGGTEGGIEGVCR